MLVMPCEVQANFLLPRRSSWRLCGAAWHGDTLDAEALDFIHAKTEAWHLLPALLSVVLSSLHGVCPSTWALGQAVREQGHEDASPNECPRGVEREPVQARKYADQGPQDEVHKGQRPRHEQGAQGAHQKRNE